MTFRTQPHQQQVATFDDTCEIGNGDAMPAIAAPDICKYQLLGFSGNACPQCGCRIGEFRNGFDAHGIKFSGQSKAVSKERIATAKNSEISADGADRDESSA